MEKHFPENMRSGRATILRVIYDDYMAMLEANGKDRKGGVKTRPA